MNIKILKPNGQMEEIKYYDILYFCQRTVEEYISISKENLQKFKDYRELYQFFEPYFDFVMQELKYIIIEPFFYHDTYLLPYNHQYFIMNYNGEGYQQLISQIPNFSFDFLPVTDMNIGLQHHVRNLKREGFYIDVEGNIFKNTTMKRHLMMARSLLNQQLIHQTNTCFSYQRYVEKHGENAMCDFLVEKLGFILGCPSEENKLIYNSKLLTKEQHQRIMDCQIKYQIKSKDYYKPQFFR